MSALSRLLQTLWNLRFCITGQNCRLDLSLGASSKRRTLERLYSQTTHRCQDSSNTPLIFQCAFERGAMEGPPDGSLYDRQHYPDQSFATPPYTLLPQNADRGVIYLLVIGNNTYPQHPYPGAWSSMMPQSTAASPPQPTDPSPATTGGRALRVLLLEPDGGVLSQSEINFLYSQHPLMPQTSMVPDSNPPTHAVGSQDRRGILRRAPGTPEAPAAGTTQAKNQIFQKNDDGRFPCPHCTKTYVNAKYVKRHLLIHTGERPFMCILCRRTFSRSDILKRHFIKCATLRGNPSGASHLSHPQARAKKNAAARQNPAGVEGNVNHIQ
ncbi:hypothetical protein VTK56DRAFT_6302 [Thermocarpiscus australiensis]